MPPRRRVAPQRGEDSDSDDGDGPSLAQAERFRASNMVHDDKGNKYPLWGTDISVLAKYGIGVTLYFSFVKSVCKMFAVLSFLYLPSMALNYYGPGRGEGWLARSTLGNLGTDFNSTTVFGRTFTKAESSLYVALCDLAACLYFVIHVSYLSWRLARSIKATDAGQVTPSDYSIVVYGLPPSVKDEEVREFFGSRYGKVAEVEFGTNEGAYLRSLMLRGKQRMKLSDLQAKVKRLESMGGTANEMLAQLFFERIDETEVKLRAGKLERAEMARTVQKKVAVAFVVFEMEAHFLDCITDYHDSKKWTTRVMQDRNLRWDPKHKLSVSIAPEPSEIVWEHLEADAWRRRKMRARVNLITLFILLCSFAVVFEARKYQSQQQKIATTICPSEAINATHVESCYGGHLDLCLTDPWGGCGMDSSYEPFTQFYNPDQDSTIEQLADDCSGANWKDFTVNCYCRSLSEAAVEHAAVCQSYLANQFLSTVVLRFSSVSVVGVNIWIKGVLTRLTKQEMHHTVSSEMRSVFYKVLIAQFMNTCALSIIASANIEYTFPGPKAALDVSGRGLGDGDYHDFNEAWYLNTGAFLLNTLINNVVTFMIPILWLLPKTRVKLWKIRREHRNNTLLIGTQHGLNMRLLGPHFKLSIRYAQVTAVVWFVFGFCPGLPLLPVIGLGVICAAYWVDKYALLNLYRKPPFYDESLPRAAVSAMPVGLVMHVLFGVWMLGRDDLTGNESIADNLNEYTEAYGFNFNGTDTGFNEQASLYDQVSFKLLRVNTMHLTVLAALLLLGWLVWNLAGKWITRFLLLAVKGRQVFYEAEGVPPFSEGQKVMAKAQVLNTYNIRANLLYKELFLKE